MADIILKAEHIDKSFGVTHAVRDVSLDFYEGEIHGMNGENGSGKSTHCAMLTGIYPIGSGRFVLDGKELHVKNQVEANREGVSIIVQEMGTLSGLTVAENIFLGNENRFVKAGIKNGSAMNREAQKYLNEYGLSNIQAEDSIDD